MSRRSQVALLCAGLLLSACATDGPPGPEFALRDSVGIAIAENRGEMVPGTGGWALSSSPSLKIGAASGDNAYLLFGVWGVTRLSDGRIAVANSRAPDLRIFSGTGEHLKTFGRRGEGPGEFNSPVLMGSLAGDTLVVVDRLLRRLYLFDPDRGFVRGVTADPGIPGYLLTAGMFSSGSVLVWTSEWEVEMPNGFYRFPIHYRSVGLDGALQTDFGEFPGHETLIVSREVEGGTASMSTDRPFGKAPVVAVHGNRLFYGSQDRYEIQVFDPTGALLRLIRRDKDPVPVTDAHVRAIMEENADRAEDSDQLREFRRMYREAPIPEFHPAHGPIYADAMGFLWVEEYRLPGEAVRIATIFEPTGRMVGALELPAGFRVEEIGEDYVLGRFADDLGVEYVQMYTLTRPSR